MPTSPTFSSVFISALRSSLAKDNLLDPVVARGGPELQSMLADPTALSWWPMEPIAELVATLQAVTDEARLRALFFDASHSRMGPIVRPLVNVLLAVMGATPNTLMSRAGAFASLGVRPVQCLWERTSHTSGTMRFVFEVPVPPQLAVLWWGFLLEGFDLLKAGRITDHGVEATTHRFDISWS